MDFIIKNGRIIDGTGNPFFKADIGIDEGKIEYVGNLKRSYADRVVDASRLIVCPGFIDIHSHSDFVLITNPTMDAKIHQGVTSELNGNCGHSPSPLIGPEMRRLRYYPKKMPDWSTTKEYFKVLEDQGHATNVMSLLGYVNVRVAVVGLEEREPNENELSLMQALVTQGMEDGLFGLSTGLEYPPSSFATTEELVELCKVVSDYGGVYVSHIRNESRLLIEAVEEAVRIGKESGVGVECVHHKAFGRIYSDRIPITLNIIDEARKEGVDVTLDVYPYIRDSGDFTGWLPAWAHAGGPVELLKRLVNPETRKKIKAEINNLIEEPGSLLSTAILTCLRKNPELSGKMVAELAYADEMDIIDFAIDLLVKEEGVGVGISSEFGTEENLEKILSHPASMISSDGSGVSVNIKEWTHPRNYGTYARLLGRYVRDKGTLTLQEAIRKSTSLPAQRLGLKNRGLIREEMWADIIVFDYNKIRDNYSLNNPNQYAEGVEYVLVNGRLVLDEGRHTGDLPGKVLRKG